MPYIKNLLLLFISFLLIGQIHAEADIYDFNGPKDIEPTSFIISESGAELQKSKFVEVYSVEGFYLRVKFIDPYEGSSFYDFYKGNPSEDILNLSKYPVPNDIKYSQFLRKRFYSSRTANSDEIQYVYFDGKHIYANTQGSIYYKKGNMILPLKSIANNDRSIFESVTNFTEDASLIKNEAFLPQQNMSNSDFKGVYKGQKFATVSRFAALGLFVASLTTGYFTLKEVESVDDLTKEIDEINEQIEQGIQPGSGNDWFEQRRDAEDKRRDHNRNVNTFGLITGLSFSASIVLFTF